MSETFSSEWTRNGPAALTRIWVPGVAADYGARASPSLALRADGGGGAYCVALPFRYHGCCPPFEHSGNGRTVVATPRPRSRRKQMTMPDYSDLLAQIPVGDIAGRLGVSDADARAAI